MSDIKPMSVKDMPYERALGLPPSLELDMYVMHNIVQGPDEAMSPDRIGSLPAFSRKFGDCQMLLVMAAHEVGQLNVVCDPSYFQEARDKGFIKRLRPCVVWRIESSGKVGYGRNFGEALCKLLIVTKYVKG